MAAEKEAQSRVEVVGESHETAETAKWAADAAHTQTLTLAHAHSLTHTYTCYFGSSCDCHNGNSN